MAIRISSSAFADGGDIPQQHSCEGTDTAPPLEWSGLPAQTRSLALIVHDPDAPRGDFTHWVVFNLPADLPSLPAGGALPPGARVGRNDFGRNGWGGPCPPPGKPHRYIFTLFALDSELQLPAGATRETVLDALDGHVLDQGQLTGRFKR